MNKWNIDEFVDVLNKEIPLGVMNEQNSLDKRRSNAWTKRMVRTYFSTAELTPAIKDGKQRLYNDEHLEEFRKLIELQYSGVPYKTATSVLKSSYSDISSINSLSDKQDLIRGSSLGFVAGSTGTLSFPEPNIESSSIKGSSNNKRDNALDLLRSFAETKKTEGNMWLKYVLTEGVEINIREDILKDKSFIKEIKKWINEQ